MFKSLCVVAGMAVILSGCSGTSHTLAAKASSDSSSMTASPSVKPSVKTKPVVPVDQIPPGDPDSWIPAGVSPNAPFQAPGDLLPMFTRAMFENQAAGAQAMANYYLRAQNWALALGLDSTPFAIVCDWNQCKAGAANFTRERAAGQRVYGGRRIFAGSTLRAAPSSIDADFIVQFRVKMGAGKRVDSLGKTLATGLLEAMSSMCT